MKTLLSTLSRRELIQVDTCYRMRGYNNVIKSNLNVNSSTVAATDYHQIRDADWSIQIFS